MSPLFDPGVFGPSGAGSPGAVSTIPLAPLDEALIAMLDVTTVTDLAVGGVVDDLPQDPTYPIVRVTSRGKPYGPIAGHAHWECDVEIDIYSKYHGDRECLEIANVIAGILNMQPVIVTGWTVHLISLLDVYEISDEFVKGETVKRWTMPFLALLTVA